MWIITSLYEYDKLNFIFRKLNMKYETEKLYLQIIEVTVSVEQLP